MKLNFINIPNGVTSIEDGAFSYCTNLKEIELPYRLTNINHGVFTACSSLADVIIPNSVTNISGGAFCDCVSLTDILIPNTVTAIESHAFGNCESMTNISLCNGLNYIGEYAFEMCTRLTRIIIPDSVTYISKEAFSSTGLISVTIPKGIQYINYHSFSGPMTELYIPLSVVNISGNAFEGCNSLKDIYYEGTEEQWEKICNSNYNRIFRYANIHFEWNKRLYTQSHTIKNFSNNNLGYATKYMTGAGTALDGANSTPSMVIPGLKNGENMIPQGIAYYNNKILISSYFKDGSGAKKPSMIFALNIYSGDLVEEYKLKDVDGSYITGHVGGIAVSGNNIYVANGKYIYYFNAKEMNSNELQATAKKKISGMNGFSSDASCAYVTVNNGVLWTGNFYDNNVSDYKKPANEKYNSVMLGFSLAGSGDGTEWNDFNSKAQPDVTINIPNSIENVQCATVYNNKLLLSSSLGRNNTSRFYTANISNNFKVIESSVNSFTGLPMMEGFVVFNNSLYSINESGAYFYCGGKANTKDPTDVVWKYNLSKLINTDISAPTAGDVENETVTFVDGEKGTVNGINLKQSWFTQDSMEYNHQLAILCSQYAMIGYDNVKSKKPNLEKALSTLGMSGEIEIQPVATKNQVNYFLANRKINAGGKQYTLIFAGFIGSYHDQWYSNFDPGTGDTHQGFNNAKEYVYEKLESYISKLGISKDDTKILITGHSRGAATANLVAAKLIKEQKLASASNVYTYAFATPNSTKLKEKENIEYKRIFNFVNPEDFVTKCMPAAWGYGRYGTTFVLPSKTNTYFSYSNYKRKMQSYFSDFTGGKEYKNYVAGEATSYTAIKSLTLNVWNTTMFYNVPLMAGFVPMTTYSFFQNTLCHFVSKTASNAELAAAGTIVANTLGTATSNTAYRDILNYFIVNGALNSHFEDSHCAQTYCAYISSMTAADMCYRNGFLCSVNCPVDVEVYDKSTGELVGRIINNVVDETIAAKDNAIVMTVDGDSKQYWLPSDGKYEVKLIGNDDGKMDYTVETINSETGETERVNFFDVRIEKGKSMTGEFVADEIFLENLTLERENGEILEPTETQDNVGKVKIDTVSDDNGYVTESTSVTSGDYVTVSATPKEGYAFKGWYNGDELVSSDNEYSFVAKNNITLTAKFAPIPKNVKSVSIDDISLNYKKSTTLKPTIKADDGAKYKVEYSTSNAKVATVDQNGKVTATKRGSGTATITCTVTDSNGNVVKDTCKVSVSLTWWQWIITIVLFGWIWY